MSDANLAVAKKREKIKLARRRAKVLEMYNKGHTQEEMAGALGVDQSTISRDIRALSAEASGVIDELYNKRLKLECARLITGVDGATRIMWEVLDDKDLPPRQRIAAVATLLKCYEARKAFFPAVQSATEYLEQRKEMMDDFDKMFDAAIKERGLDEPEGDQALQPRSKHVTMN